ncbi:MAG: tRNA pseudouridine(55) synthase TruB, partial [Aestuariivirgaceae bacterium]
KTTVPITGWLILDKPLGMTSATAVARVRKLFSAAKAGHAGTLDPLATGLLPIALGEATKTVSIVMDGWKTYRFTVGWGSETTTDDGEGIATAQSGTRPSGEDIRALLPRFIGRIDQVPPSYSAIRVEGERAYAHARQGRELSLAARSVSVEALELLEARPDEADFQLRCGKGTYVRAIARDLGRSLGSFGHVTALRRTATGPFTEADMISLAKLEEFGHNDAGRKAMMTVIRPLRTALDDIPALALSEAESGRLRQGQSVPLRSVGTPREGDIVLVLSNEKPLALAALKDGVLHPKRVFNL